MKTISFKLSIGLCAAAMLACAGGSSDTTISAPPSGGEAISPDATQQQTPTDTQNGATCDQGITYKGFGGRVLVAGRVDNEQNLDRARVKPYSALAGEYARVLGKTPSLLGQLGTTFSQPPNRWYLEPQASAVSLYSAFRVAFVGCLDLTASDAAYANAPDATSAATVCNDLGRKFWSRSPDSNEIDACVKVAVQDTQKETNPRRRWAYTCASLLSSAGFITY